MKKNNVVFLTSVIWLVMALFTSCGTNEKTFYTVRAEVIPMSMIPHTHTVCDSVIVDSLTLTINCWYAFKENPYVDIHVLGWCHYEQITGTLIGDPTASEIINSAMVFADDYRNKNYPNRQ